MIQLTPEQKEYKEKTLHQLRIDQGRLETSLTRETRPEVIRSIEEQLHDIEAHINRLQDELSGNVVFDEPIADELFKQAAKALAGEKFHMANKYINRLETIEPFHPALPRLRQEAESGKPSRRTRSIAQGTATTYPGVVLPSTPAVPAIPAQVEPEQPLPAGPTAAEAAAEEPVSWYAHFFQFHIMVSCLVIVLLGCVMLGMFGVAILEWLVASV
jgi:hypothetical protein